MKYDSVEKRRKIGDCTFNCPNCGKEHYRVIWEDKWEDEDEWSGFEHADALCSCGAQILISVQPDGETGLYWLNEKKMKLVVEGEEAER